MKVKTCLKCNELKQPYEFYSNKNNADGLTLWCKTCMKQNPSNQNQELKKGDLK
jgi:hypothetical protein